MRKDELERQEREGRRMQRRLQTAEHVSTTLEICPRFVVPDTNCFIDHLAEIRRIALAGGGLFGVRVPVVVLGELDGLAKGGGAHTQLGKASGAVADSAQRALSFLHSCMSSSAASAAAGGGGGSVKAVTSKGSTLNSLAVTTEEDALRGGPGTYSLALHFQGATNRAPIWHQNSLDWISRIFPFNWISRMA